MLIVLFVMLNFLALLTTISDHGLEFRLGLFARRFDWSQIAGAEAKPYNWLTYLGWESVSRPADAAPGAFPA